jgi:hypothetical protein
LRSQRGLEFTDAPIHLDGGYFSLQCFYLPLPNHGRMELLAPGFPIDYNFTIL